MAIPTIFGPVRRARFLRAKTKMTSTPPTWSLQTSSSYGDEDFRLVELNSVLEEAIEKGEKLYFCGGTTDDAVLCTPSHSFRVVSNKSSNANVLLPYSCKNYDSGGDKENQQDTMMLRASTAFHYEVGRTWKKFGSNQQFFQVVDLWL